MGIFNNIFGENKTENNLDKKTEAKFYSLNKMTLLDEIDNISQTKPVVIFKHSTRCIISRTALKNFESDFNFFEDKIDWYLLDLLTHRDVSNEIANRYNVTHQSPQILVIKNGKAIFSESHDGILAEDLKQFI